MGKSNSIINVLRIIFVTVAIVLSGVTVYLVTDYWLKQSQIIPQYSNVLEVKGREYAEQLNSFFEVQIKKAGVLSSSQELIAAWQLLKEGQNKDGIQELKRITKEFEARMRESGAFKNVMLATTDGDILFSLNQPEYVGINLRQQPYASTNLGYSFARTLMSLAPDISEFYFDDIVNRPALYICTKIFSSGMQEGVLIAQVDHNMVYQLTQNYLGLGKTGEFVVSERQGDRALIIVPTRLSPHIAFKKSGIHEPGKKSLLEEAINANRGTGFGYDYRKKYVLAYWDYLPNLDWGFDVKIDYDEIISTHKGLRSIALIFLLLTLVVWLIAALSFPSVRDRMEYYGSIIHKNISFAMFSLNASLLIFAFSLFGALYFFYQLNHAKSQALEHAKIKAQQAGAEAVKNIEYDLERIASLDHALDEYLSAGKHTPDELITNLKREINEEPKLFALSIAHLQSTDHEKTVFAPYATRKDGKIKVFQLEDILKEQEQHDPDFMHQEWFRKALEEKKGVWTQPTKEYLTGKLVVIYAEPFFDSQDSEHEKPLGVVAAFYAIDSLLPFLLPLHIGETGYPSIVTKSGKFVYHPLEAYGSDKNLFTEAKETDNIDLSKIDQAIIAGEAGIDSYFGLRTNRMMWIAYQPIPKIGWSLILRFVEQEINPPIEESHHREVWVVICTVLALLCLCYSLMMYFELNVLRVFAFVASFIFVLGIMGIWSLAKPDIDVKNGMVVYNAIGLDSYVAELTQDARQRHEPEPILLPTGIFLESWGSAGPEKVDVTGTIWQIYNDTQHKGITREFNLPDATNVKITNQYKFREGENETVGATLNATIVQQFDFSKFPLDSQRIKISINHKNLEKNMLLVPDLPSYESISPTTFPGIDKQFKYYGFTIRRSFFSLEKMREETDFGVHGYSDISDHIKLNFNIIVTRDLMNALIVYFMPLLVILISLFAIFAVTGRSGKKGAQKSFVSIASYTGLLFALVVLNIALRNQYPSGNVLYLEYFFFYTYLTILILIVHGAFVQAETLEEMIDEKVTPVLKNLFWPVQLGVWFITTVIVFYT